MICPKCHGSCEQDGTDCEYCEGEGEICPACHEPYSECFCEDDDYDDLDDEWED